MRIREIAGLTLAVLILVGCEKPAPVLTRKTVDVKEATPEAVKSINTFVDKLNTAQRETSPKPYIISALAAYQAGAILLNAADGPTSLDLAKIMGTDEQRVDILNQSQMAIIDHLKTLPGRPYRSFNSLWMIWPIKISKYFQDDAMRNYGTTIQKLGSAGKGSTTVINKWFEDNSDGRIKSFEPELQKSDIWRIMNVTLFDDGWVQGRSGGGKTEVTGFTNAKGTFKTTLVSGLEFFSSAKLDLSDLDGKFETPALASFPTIPDAFETDLMEPVKSIGLGRLVLGPIDLHLMSVELKGDYALGGFAQSIRLNIKDGKAPGDTAPAVTYPKWPDFAIRDPKTKTILILGSSGVSTLGS